MTTVLNEKEESLRKLKETLRKSQQQGEESCKSAVCCSLSCENVVIFAYCCQLQLVTLSLFFLWCLFLEIIAYKHVEAGSQHSGLRQCPHLGA